MPGRPVSLNVLSLPVAAREAENAPEEFGRQVVLVNAMAQPLAHPKTREPASRFMLTTDARPVRA